LLFAFLLYGGDIYRQQVTTFSTLTGVGIALFFPQVDVKYHRTAHEINLQFQGPDITWRQLMCQLLGLQPDIFYDNLLEFISDRIGSAERTRAIAALGLVSEKPVEKMGSPLNTLSNHLAQGRRKKQLNLSADQGVGFHVSDFAYESLYDSVHNLPTKGFVF
jgi:hypothetical protein